MKEILTTILAAGAASGAVVAGVVQAIKFRIKDYAWVKSWMYFVLALLGSLAAIVVFHYYSAMALTIIDNAVLFVVTFAASQGVYFIGMEKSDPIDLGE